MYSYVTEDKPKCEKRKGLNNSAGEYKLKHENYKNVLFNATNINHKMNRIHSRNYNVSICRINETYLSWRWMA